MVVQCLSTVYRLEGDNAALPSTPLPLAVRVSLVVSYLSNHSKQAIFAKAVSTGAAPVVVVRFVWHFASQSNSHLQQQGPVHATFTQTTTTTTSSAAVCYIT